MWSSVRNTSLVLSALVLAGSAHAEDIRVCLWEGPAAAAPALAQYQHRYRGALRLEKHGGLRCLINELDIEDYVAGVIAKEMSQEWPEEALKAQAVCSRTLAVIKVREKKARYDVKDSILHQVYGSCEDARVIKAVAATCGEVLSRGGQVVPVYFHACCGGSTSDAASVWVGSDPGANGGVADRYCRGTPYFEWSRTFTRGQLGRLLGIEDLKEVRVEERDSAGRARRLAVIRRNGLTVSLPGDGKDGFRLRINGRAGQITFTNGQTIPSTRFTIRTEGDTITLAGTGYGHGVGLCQWGARRMAEAGLDYRTILVNFFPTLAMVRLTEKEDYGD